MSCCIASCSVFEKGTVPFWTWYHHRSLPGHFSRDSQLAVIITTSYNYSYLGSKKKKNAQVNTGPHLGHTSTACGEGALAILCFSSFSVAPACHLIRTFKPSPCMRHPSFNRLEADGEGGPARPSGTSADHDSAFWLQCVVISDSTGRKSA